MERYILFYPIDHPVRREGEGYRVIEIRECKYREVDVLGNLDEVIRDLGQPLFFVKVGEAKTELWDLLNDCRFWEAHELLEGIWRGSNGAERKYLQALILLCASMIKYRKNRGVSDELMERALSLISELPQDLLPLLYVRLGLNSQWGHAVNNT
ncbi:MULTISPECIES: DUF309 domain-containing protein [Metallosphaera]|uniref:DUF309 domain-containing protein n=1 Tax=Metallosphaera TaxID=41980 RepID=UPI001F05F9D3|nr:DUF309 domain-containing protein [Metallosphaera sedula]MCH1770728.1 DUF309 domain-containing protein [Metallosphaera sedula]MCP6728926.1 DUF309 domain-containing protein [Metallosphaera sedula]BBL48148.1 hypothetical protein MJ1HA_2266 [Metallosphaera sedula]